MALTRKQKIAASLIPLFVAVLLAALFFRNPGETELAARRQLLQLISPDASSVIYIDLAELRASPFFARLNSWAPQPPPDSEYAQFLRDTGFSYERDLDRMAIGISRRGETTELFAVADGKFDRKKIEAFLARNSAATQQGQQTIFTLKPAPGQKPVSLTFLSDTRIALTDETVPTPAASAEGAGRADWNTRFERVAGSPVFAVIRQDAAMQQALTAATPGGFRSPQLASLLEQQLWISIAGKPAGDRLLLIADGESLSDAAESQLRELLQGVIVMAQTGLNDPKLRQQMNSEERDAYLELLQSADVQKIDRGQWKTVRVSLFLTPKFFDVAARTSLVPKTQSGPPPSQPTPATKPAAPRPAKKN